MGSVYAEVDPSSGLGWVWIDHPQRQNAMSIAMWERLREVFEELARDPAVRVVVLQGVGETFCAGADVSEFGRARTGEDALRYDERTEAALEAIARIPVPVVSVVQGWCLGGGVSLAVACDLILAVAGARFGIPAANLSTAYPTPALARLAQRVGRARALMLIATARRISEGEAHAIGLVDLACVTLQEAVAEVEAMARRAPLTLRATKSQLVGGFGEQERARIFSSADYAEGLAAFAERRAPRFRGR
jgi:enoyl-CoA hydratase